jgi:hypothetical protein
MRLVSLAVRLVTTTRRFERPAHPRRALRQLVVEHEDALGPDLGPLETATQGVELDGVLGLARLHDPEAFAHAFAGVLSRPLAASRAMRSSRWSVSTTFRVGAGPLVVEPDGSGTACR